MVRGAVCLSLLLQAYAHAQQPPGNGIAAYGRVSPGDGVITVAVPDYLGSPQVVEELFVTEGDQVGKGQKLAVTQAQGLAAADLEVAKAHLTTVEAQLVAMSAGPKSEEILAQQDLVKIQEAEANAEKAKKWPDTASGKDEGAASVEAALAKVSMNEHQLAAMRQVRPEDLAVAQAEVDEAKAAVTHAQELFARTTVNAPIDGQVLKILAHPGEDAGRGLLELADTRAMVIIGELNAADAYRVKIGARVTIKSEAWPGEMAGTVTRISPRVDRANLTALSTFANVDREIVEATITPATPEKLAGLTGAEVTVLIAGDPGAK